MSRALFLRVRAQTYDENDVPENWPMLCMLVWPAGEPAKARSPAEPSRERGVLELAEGIEVHALFGDVPDSTSFLHSGGEKLAALRRELDEALGNRDVRNAQRLCDAVEETLDELEKLLRAVLRA